MQEPKPNHHVHGTVERFELFMLIAEYQMQEINRSIEAKSEPKPFKFEKYYFAQDGHQHVDELNDMDAHKQLHVLMLALEEMAVELGYHPQEKLKTPMAPLLSRKNLFTAADVSIVDTSVVEEKPLRKSI